MNYIIPFLPLVVLIYYISRKDIKKAAWDKTGQWLTIAGYAVIIYAVSKVYINPSDNVGWGPVVEFSLAVYGSGATFIGAGILIVRLIKRQ